MPKSWTNIDEDPVVPFALNLNGHPLAGLWGRPFEAILSKLGFVKKKNWEFFFVHRKQGLFLSLYVNDIKMWKN